MNDTNNSDHITYTGQWSIKDNTLLIFKGFSSYGDITKFQSDS